MSYNPTDYTAKKLNHPHYDSVGSQKISGFWYQKYTSKPKGRGSAIFIRQDFPEGKTSQTPSWVVLINPFMPKESESG